MENFDFITEIDITKIKESVKNFDFITEITEIKKSKEGHIKLKTKIMENIAEIEELAKDIVERITKIEELEKDSNKWKIKIEELKKEFIERINKIEELSKNPNKWEIEIEKEKLRVDKDLIRLICTEVEGTAYNGVLDVITSKISNNNDIIVLTSIGIFIFHLNKNMGANH